MKDFYSSQKVPISLVIAIIVLGAFYAYSRLEISLFPEVTFPKIKVIADAGELPVDQMMESVTKPLESAIKRVPDLQDLLSTTSRGSCEISAFMYWGSDIDMSSQRIESLIEEVRSTLPPEVSITVERMNPSILPVIGYSLESNSQSLMDLKDLAVYTIAPYLSQAEGVSQIKVVGGQDKEYWIIPDFEKLRSLGLTPDDLNTILTQSGVVKSNGFLNDFRMMYLTITDTRFKTISDIENLVIRNSAGRIVHVKDIAQVKIHAAHELVKISANGHQGVLISVIKQPSANLLITTDAVQRRLEGLKEFLPGSVTLRPFYVQANFVRDSIRGVLDSIWIGLLLAMVVAFAFLRSVKAGATILVSVSITIGLTLIILLIIHETINIMTLGAIAASIGLIIDDAIVVVEKVHRIHEENPGESPSSLVQKGISTLFRALLGSSLSTIVIFLPFKLMSGVAGAFFTAMTNTMIIILTSSFLVTWIILPVVYLGIAKLPDIAPKKRSNTNTELAKNRNALMWFIKRPVWSIGLSAFYIVIIVLTLPHLRSGFLPDMDEGSIVLDYETPPGTSLQETDNILKRVEKIIDSIPDVEAWSRRTGTQMGFFITEPNTGDYLIQLKKKRSTSTAQIIDLLRTKIESSEPALTVDFGQVITDMIGDLMSSVQPVEVKIFGSDQNTLHNLSRKVAQIVSNVRGAADVFDGVVIAGPLVSVAPDYSALSRVGLTPQNFQYQVQTSLEGNVAGSVYENERVNPIRLIYPGSENSSFSDLKNLSILLPGNKSVRITNIASIKIDSGQAEIHRENLQSMGDVTARLENRDLGGVMKDIRREVKANLALPSGYHIEYGGAYKLQQQSFRELLIILFTSSALVMCVLLFLYKEYRSALVILPSAAIGIAGSFLALFVTGTALNVGSYTGLIMIVGIISENAIFTFSQFRAFRDEFPLDEAIARAVSVRVRPNLMTAVGAIAALLPIALGIGTGTAMHRPLAIAVIGGFLAAIPILLIVLPGALRAVYGEKKKKISNIE
jgi:CzcA family heavy metal efflux pump